MSMLRRVTSRLGSVVQRKITQEDVISGRRLNYSYLYDDLYDKHKNRVSLEGDALSTPMLTGKRPRVQWSSFIAPNSTLIGNVEVWDYASVWYNVVVKADVNMVVVGAFVNIQDNTTVCEALAPLSLHHDGSTVIGHYTTIGHSCTLQACTIEEQCLVGMGSTLGEDSYMERSSSLGAGSVLARGVRVPSGELWVGNPARFKRMLSEEEVADFRQQSYRYWELAKAHKQEFYFPTGTAYIEAEKCGYPVGWEEDFWGNKYERIYVPPSKRPGFVRNDNNTTTTINTKNKPQQTNN